MKLIIDIPDRIYKINQNRTLNITDSEILEKAVRSGIPLDDVKAEIKTKEMVETDIERQFYNMALDDVNKILDNIGKAESEDT